MSIVVTTPTGNIGRHVTENLLGRGQAVTVIARDASKVKALASRGVKVITGSHDDAALLTKATEGAEALFLLTPPNMVSEDIRAFYRGFGRAAAKAIRENRLSHVVHLSSVGADLSSGTGPVAGLYDNEAILNEAAANIIHLRPGYFMENTLMQIGSIKQAKSLFTSLPGSLKVPMIATGDIGRRAAELLVARDWSGQSVRELQGPGDISYDEITTVLSEVLGLTLTHVTITPEQQKGAMMGMGISAHIADAFNELSEAITVGRLVFREPRSEKNSTETSYPVFAQQIFKPAFEAS